MSCASDGPSCIQEARGTALSPLRNGGPTTDRDSGAETVRGTAHLGKHPRLQNRLGDAGRRGAARWGPGGGVAEGMEAKDAQKTQGGTFATISQRNCAISIGFAVEKHK